MKKEILEGMLLAERRDNMMFVCENLGLKIYDVVPMHGGRQIAMYLPRTRVCVKAEVDPRCFVLSEN